MRAANSAHAICRRENRLARVGLYAGLAAASLLVARAWAGQENAMSTSNAEASSLDRTSRVVPNAKVAAALSMLTNFPYDAQHLPVKRLKLVDKDTRMRFEVEIRKDAVVPNEPKRERSQEDIEEQGKEGEMKQGEQQGQAAGPPAEKAEETRTIYFAYDLATGKVTRLDNLEAPKKKPMWASVSPDEKTVVFARQRSERGRGTIDDRRSGKIQLCASAAAGAGRALRKQDEGDTNKAGPRTAAVTIHWSKDSKKFALERNDDRKVGDYWVIHSLTNPRPILETRSYALPGEANVPIGEIDIFDVASKQRVVVEPKSFVDEVLNVADAAQTERDREELREEQEENRQNPAPLSRLSPKWLADTSDMLYFASRSRDFRQVEVDVADTATGKVEKLIEEGSNVWMTQKPLRLVGNGKEMLWWSSETPHLFVRWPGEARKPDYGGRIRDGSNCVG